jgi:hypothetical protein
MKLRDIECIFKVYIDEMEVPDEWCNQETGEILSNFSIKFDDAAHDLAVEELQYNSEFEVEDYWNEDID